MSEATEPMQETEALSDMESVIGNSIVINGEIQGNHSLIVHGKVRGRVDIKECLIIEAGGVVEADVETTQVDIAGHLIGNITATDRVDLRPDSSVTGDIKSPRIHIADGASFKGNVNMDC